MMESRYQIKSRNRVYIWHDAAAAFTFALCLSSKPTCYCRYLLLSAVITSSDGASEQEWQRKCIWELGSTLRQAGSRQDSGPDGSAGSRRIRAISRMRGRSVCLSSSWSVIQLRHSSCQQYYGRHCQTRRRWTSPNAQRKHDKVNCHGCSTLSRKPSRA